MKRIIALLLSVLMLLTLCVGCGKQNSDSSDPSDSSDVTENDTGNKDTGNSGNETTDPTQPEGDTGSGWSDYQCITIAEALTLCEGFVDAPSADRYYICATVKSIDNDTYGQMTVTDATGSIMVYGSANADGSLRYDAMDKKPVAGDEVLLYGTLQNYKGSTKEIQNAWIIDFVSKNTGSQPAEPAQLPADGTELTVAQLLALPVPSGVTTTQQYLVKATVESVSNAAYGTMWIKDSTGSISVYNSKNADGSVGYAEMTDKPFKGDSITVKCTVQNFNGTMEIKQAYIVDFKHAEVSVDPGEYAKMTVAAARDAKTGTKVQISGVVAAITYANGMIPAGIILADKTASIYVYDGDLAARCAVGNTVTICASKTYWVLESEQNNASKFGYKGCNQLESATLVDLESTKTDFDKSWVKTTTVKDLLDTPVTQDITSKIYKVTAQVVKAPGKGFTNYYINDLDGKTGSYAYTQCNGSDFAWLDAFDGKVCTVYLVALNAKSTSSDCFWRFLPVAVKDEGFDPASVNAAEHAVKYYGLPQFQKSYSGDPALQLLTSIDAPLLKVTGAKLSYTSGNEVVISVKDNVMHCLKTGSADITVTGSYGGKTYSEKITISVKVETGSQNYPTVSEAISASVDSKVTVKGIVGPSLVNKTGFYLIDKTGVIAVETTADILSTLKIGNEVVLEATRAINSNGGNGQTCLKNAVVVLNNYGNHSYPTDAFKGSISVKDFYALNVNEDHTTSVYTMKATVQLEESAYYTNISLTDGSTSIRLYCSSASQYNWLKAYAGQEVTVEIAPCNWNSKTYYTGCVLAVVNADGSKVLNTLNFQ